jgi:hypothetical protein
MTQATTGSAVRSEIEALAAQGLYQPEAEKDACGVGFVAHIKGNKDHRSSSRA